MTQAFTPGLQCRRSYKVKRVRELSVPGQILVKEGDQVSAMNVVAKAQLPGDLLILRISEQLGIEPFEVLKGLKIKVGDEVKKGELLCEHAGLFGILKSKFHAPVDGKVEFVTEHTGHIGLRMSSKPIELKAYIGGIVTHVDAGKAVTIESQAVFVQGIFGVGGERHGILKALNVSNDVEVSINDLPTEMKGCILFGGSKTNYETLIKAQDAGAVAFITGSIDDQTLSAYLGFDLGIALTGNEDITMSLIVTEGFGHIPMSARISDLLREFEGKEASVNGATQVRAGAIRPEIIVSGLQFQESGADQVLGGQESESGLKIGARIRIIRVPYFGMKATVIDMPHEAVQIETGAFTRVLKAKLDDGREITVPRANVEI